MYLDDRRPPVTPQLALRVAIIGGIALVGFAIIFFRLWYLEVLSGDRYLAVANDNRVRTIKVEAPRGQILDRKGRILVDNRSARVVQISPDKLPTNQRIKTRVYDRLSEVLGMNRREIRTSVRDQLRQLPFASATVKTDVPLATVSYIRENADLFPGVTAELAYLRSYPHDKVGAHLFGIVGEVTEKQLKEERYRGISQGDRVGQGGIEYQYDRYLRGKNGARRIIVDALNVAQPKQLRPREPTPGRNLRLSIDLKAQQVGQQALAGQKGAFVAMEVKTGKVVALGSSPSFDPNIFAKTIKASDYKRLNDAKNGAPLANRAIQGLYPTGSIFKLVTATAALESGSLGIDEPVSDPGSLEVGGVTFKNAGDAVNGVLSLRRALTVSSDVFFYKQGLELNTRGDGLELQKWARRLGIGRRTGIDLPGEAPGLVPNPAWRNRLFEKKLTDRPWAEGDNINLSVGQGDLQADPLQMAVAYATLANGGRVVRPRLGEQIEDGDGRVMQEFEFTPRRNVNIKEENRKAILEGIQGASNAPGGTSTDVFKGFPIPVSGKTGTAEKGLGRADQSWYAALAGAPNDPKYVVITTSEAGGFGAATAAPQARRIIAALYDLSKTEQSKIVKGDSRTR
ncbi:MAG: penicillin-binding protein 2 [Thermoleophilaceae bacterium]|nr:penicillin-binding protein 2 [Thermoleophilaceae bacterium]